MFLYIRMLERFRFFWLLSFNFFVRLQAPWVISTSIIQIKLIDV